MAIIFDEQGRPITSDNPFPVSLSGSSIDLRGLLANRPDASAVAVGTTYWAVDRIGEADELSVSNGSTWVNV